MKCDKDEMSDSFISRFKSIIVPKSMQKEYLQTRETHWNVEFKLKKKIQNRTNRKQKQMNGDHLILGGGNRSIRRNLPKRNAFTPKKRMLKANFKCKKREQ